MNPKYHLLVAAAALSLNACTTDDTDTVPPKGGGYKLSFTIAEDSETRTTLAEGDILRWVPDDQVGIYTVGGNVNSNTMTVADINQSPVEFIGVLENSVSQGDMFYAYYPYDKAQSTDPERARLTIPAEQTQTAAGEYSGQSHPLAAVPMAIKWEHDSYAGRISSVRFRPLGAIVELQIFSTDEMFSDEEIRSVKFVSDSALAGDFGFDLTSVTATEEPQIQSDNLTAVEVKTTLDEPADVPDSKDEAARVYLTIAPGTYAGEFVVKTNVALYTFSLAEDKAMTFNRAMIKGLPADLAAADRKILDPDAPIPFKDPEVKRICVENWDTSGDGEEGKGELSYREAAAVTEIGPQFYQNGSITSFNELRYFTGLKTIEAQTFRGCNNLTSIKIPNGVTTIGHLAFFACVSLTSITIPETVTSLTGAFTGCPSLSAFYGKYASDNNRCLIQDNTLLAFAPANLTTYTIPNGVTTIGEYAFGFSIDLTNIHIPEGVTVIDNAAFSDCENLTSINIPNGVKKIGISAFANCESLTSITIPEGVTAIEGSTFWECSKLTEINISTTVTTIGESAFKRCGSLTSITIPKGVTEIGRFAFDGCGSLTSITFPEGLTAIGEHAFERCSKLTSITIPEGVTVIEGSTFLRCSRLTEINIPTNVTKIGDYAFSGCEGLKSITIPDGVTEIKYSTFSGCENLTSVQIPDGVTMISDNAFADCISLKSIQLPNELTRIGSSTFEGCIGLTSITIPDKVNWIGNYIFENCSNLTSVYCKPTTPPIIGNRAFYNTTSTLRIYVPTGSVEAYKTATGKGWNDDYASLIVEDNSATGE